MKKILMLAFLLLSVEPSICAEGPAPAARAPQPSPSEVEQPFFKNLTREHCEENSKWGSCDELLKRERQSRDDLAKDWHYYNTQRTKLPPKRWQSGGNSGMCRS